MFRTIKKWYQRAKRGWADEDTWNFDYYLCGVIIGGLKTLRRDAMGYPANLKNVEEWNDIIDKMIAGFQAQRAIDDRIFVYWEPHKDKEGFKTMKYNEELALQVNKQRDEGLKLFIEYFGNLWD